MKNVNNIQQLQRDKIVGLLNIYTGILEREMSLVEQIYDNTLVLNTTINSQESTNVIRFELANKSVVINISRIKDYSTASVILRNQYDDILSQAVGYTVEFEIDGKPNIDVMITEYLMYNTIFKVIHDYFLTVEWDYIQVQGKAGHKNKLQHAIAQRLTCRQPNVERIAQLQNVFFIARF